MKLLAGTSGYAFKEWKGGFYPADLKDDGMLGYYAGRFPTVEINNTFYRLPKQHVLEEWAAQVPEPFTFAIKASQRITHHARLKAESVGAVEFLMKNVGALGGRLGPVLFQLPPNLRKDLDRLRVFLDTLPLDRRFTIEFRHESWFDEDVFTALREHDIALCVSESEEFTGVNVATVTPLNSPDSETQSAMSCSRSAANTSSSNQLSCRNSIVNRRSRGRSARKPVSRSTFFCMFGGSWNRIGPSRLPNVDVFRSRNSSALAESGLRRA